MTAHLVLLSILPIKIASQFVKLMPRTRQQGRNSHCTSCLQRHAACLTRRNLWNSSRGGVSDMSPAINAATRRQRACRVCHHSRLCTCALQAIKIVEIASLHIARRTIVSARSTLVLAAAQLAWNSLVLAENAKRPDARDTNISH